VIGTTVKWLGVVGGMMLAGAAMAQQSSNRVAAFSDWSVFVGDDPTECWSVSKPTSTVNTDDKGKPKSVRRGDILMFVTFHKGSNAAGEISYTGGYPFAPGSTVTLDIGGTVFNLFTDGEWAWSGSPDDDAKISAALKSGVSAVVKAHSARGTNTADTFSLNGFTAALDDVSARCK
jgi:hypothetical protein